MNEDDRSPQNLADLEALWVELREWCQDQLRILDALDEQ